MSVARVTASRAEALGARLPPLMVAAERVASTVAQGIHGRRRIGVGDSFWQYRPFVTGDPVARIDWRRSAKSDRAYVRDTEWEAAQTICLWCDASPSMAWRSGGALPEKGERAALLGLALAALLLRAGEQVRLAALPGKVFRGRPALEAMAAALPSREAAPLVAASLPPHATLVLIGDFLAPLAETRDLLARLAARPVSVQLLQVLDPAEQALPYAGRVRFRGLEGEAETLVPRVDTLREAYAEAFDAHQAGLAAIAAAAGARHATHRTDHAPEAALLSLWTALDAGAARR